MSTDQEVIRIGKQLEKAVKADVPVSVYFRYFLSVLINAHLLYRMKELLLTC